MLTSYRYWYMAALASLPFCMPAGTLLGFTLGEGVAIIIGLVAFFSVTLRGNLGLVVTPMCVWLLGFILYVLLQAAIIPPVFWGPWLGLLLTLSSGIFLVFAASDRSGADEERSLEILNAICVGLLIGMSANCLFAVIQLVISIADDNTLNIVGFLSQRNNFADYVSMGLVGVLWLQVSGRIRFSVLLIITVGAACVLAWSGSRSVLIYAAIWLVLGVVVFFNKISDLRRFAKGLLIISLVTLVAQIAVPYLTALVCLAVGSHSSAEFYSLSGLARAAGPGIDFRERIPEFTKAWLIFLDNPLMGVGWGGFARESFLMQMDPRFSWLISPDLFTHSHNVLLQVLAEFGLVGAAFLVVWGGLLLGGLIKGRESAVVGGGLLLIPLSHSLVEFPLWYANFFLLFVALSLIIIPYRSLIGFKCFAFGFNFLFMGVIFSFVLYAESIYRKYQVLARPSWVHAESRQHVMSLRVLSESVWWLDHLIALALVSHYEPAVPVEGLLDDVTRINRYSPRPIGLMLEAVERMKIGDEVRANEILRQCLFAYPLNRAYMLSVVQQQVPVIQSKMLPMLQSAETDFMYELRKKRPMASEPW